MSAFSADFRDPHRNPEDDRDRRLNEVIAGYLESSEAGRAPDRSELLARHPDLAGELAAFFANRDHLDHLTAPLRDNRASFVWIDGPRPHDPSCTTAHPTPAIVPFHGAGRADQTTLDREADASDLDPDAPGDPGQRVTYFGDYELLEILAEGGMGVVYKVRQVSLDRLLALKMVRAGRFSTPEDLQRFRMEAEAAAHLDHPHIVPIHEIGEYEGRHYFSMKLVDGGNLAEHAGRYPADPRAAAKLIATVARAVHYAHQRGILHRDLKPANILLQGSTEQPLDRWIPLVTDFGLAKRFGGSHSAGLTVSGSIVGTPGYMAPEQSEGTRGSITTAVNIHALGVILYELLTGRPPYRGETMLDTLRLVREQEPTRPRLLNSRIAADLETIVLKCLEKAPSRRYHSAEAVAEDLDRWLEHLPIRARPSTVPERLIKWTRRRPWAAALLAVGIVAVASSSLAVLGLVTAARLQGVVHSKGLALEKAETELDRTRENALRIEEDHYFHGLLAAEQALSSHNPDQAGALLEECPPRLRNWEWRHLMRRLHSELRVLHGHSGFLCGPDFAPGAGREVFCATDVLPGSIWSTSTYPDQLFLTSTASASMPRPAIYRLHGPDGAAYGLTLEPKGVRVATAGADGLVKIWDVLTGKMTHLFRGHAGWAWGVAFSPDGTRLASAGLDGMIRIWNASAEADADLDRPLKTLGGHDGAVFGVAFSPDGSKLASAGSDATVRIWNLAGPETRTRILKGHEREVICVTFHPDGNRIASGGADRKVRIWNLASGREHASFHVATSRINALAFHPDGRRLAIGGLDRSVSVRDVENSQLIFDYPGHAHSVLYVGFSPDGKVLATASQDATIKLWNPNSEPGLRELRFDGESPKVRPNPGQSEPTATNPRWVGGLSFSPTRGELAAAGTNQTVAVWNSASGRLKRTFRGGGATMIAVAYDPSGTRLASAGSDRIVRVWDLRAGGDPITFSDRSEGFSSLAFSPDGTMLATGGGDLPEVVQAPTEKVPRASSDGRTIRIWNPATGREIRSLQGHIGSIHAIAFGPDGTRLVSAGADGNVRIWDPGSGDLLSVLKGHSGAVFAVAFSSDGSRIATAGADPDRSICIWDAVNGRPILPLRNHTNWIMGLAFSPDGTRLASAGADQTVRIWDPVRGREVLTLRGPYDRVFDVAFSPDGSDLAAASADGIVRIWEAAGPH